MIATSSRIATLAILISLTNWVIADEEYFLPVPVAAKDFTALKSHSPFQRSIGSSGSYVLSGVARMEGKTYATLTDVETRSTRVISQESDKDGWKVVEVKGDQADLKAMTVRIDTGSGEVFSARYEKLPPSKRKPSSRSTSSSSRGSQKLSEANIREAKESARNYKVGFSSDGYAAAPPPEMMKKLSRLSTSQREAINRKMIDLRNRGLGSETRKKIYEQTVDQTLSNRR